MLKCNVCGCGFEPTAERHYISRDVCKTGIAAAFASDSEPKLFDTFDCPMCGCQYTTQERKRVYAGFIENDGAEAELVDENENIEEAE